MTHKGILPLTLVLALFLGVAFVRVALGQSAPQSPFDAEELEMVKKLSRARIFFGHQSVGANIMAGVEELLVETGVALPVREGKDPAYLEKPCFLHAKIGQNTRPKTKMEEFFSIVGGELGARLDIAFFKFCYLDVDGKTDVGELVDEYAGTVERIRKIRPAVQIVHFTTPLTVCQKGPKAWLKRLLGRAPAGYMENRRRNEYNELLRERYAGREPLFDLAAIEATAPDGKMEEFHLSNRSYWALYPGYTDDGAHLGEEGRGILARELLLFLAGLMERADED